MLEKLTEYVPLLALWIALLAVVWLNLSEMGERRARKHPFLLAVLFLALAALPVGLALKIGARYATRIRAIVVPQHSEALGVPASPTTAEAPRSAEGAKVTEAGRSAEPARVCTIFPENNVWNTRIKDLPVDPMSKNYINSIGAALPVHPDLGSQYGIPYAVSRDEMPVSTVVFGDYAEESDQGPYRIPDSVQIEAGSDAHVLVVDQSKCQLYELDGGVRTGPGQWKANGGAIFNLTSNALRRDKWTSADAAGLPIFPGLVRYEEVHAGAIHHALRFTVRTTRKAYVWPARHAASQTLDPNLPPMGQRFRLRADFDMTGMSEQSKVILKALQEYGMLLSDNGGPWFLTGAPDSRWDSRIFEDFHKVKGADLEAVDESGLMVDPDSGEARNRGAAKK